MVVWLVCMSWSLLWLVITVHNKHSWDFSSVHSFPGCTVTFLTFLGVHGFLSLTIRGKTLKEHWFGTFPLSFLFPLGISFISISFSWFDIICTGLFIDTSILKNNSKYRHVFISYFSALLDKNYYTEQYWYIIDKLFRKPAKVKNCKLKF